MKLFRNIMDKMKPPFEEGGRWHKFKPVYTAFETFLFVPAHTTKSGSHIRDAIDLKRTMMAVIIALTPCMLFGMWNVGHQHFVAIGEHTDLGDALWLKFWFGFCRVLPLIVVSYVVGLGVEFIFAIIRQHAVNEGFLVSGLLIPLVMPVDVPLWMVAVATVFAVVIGKEVFGGTGMNVLNPALTARAFLFFAYPTEMSGNIVWTHIGEGNKAIDTFTGATPLGDLAGLIKLDAASDQLDAIMEKVPCI
ncbi:MAG: RnfABCDGE type electron transport complex subunit D, partial [Flavobacteriales bacterium]